jgi:hypothetical protein
LNYIRTDEVNKYVNQLQGCGNERLTATSTTLIEGVNVNEKKKQYRSLNGFCCGKLSSYSN